MRRAIIHGAKSLVLAPGRHRQATITVGPVGLYGLGYACQSPAEACIRLETAHRDSYTFAWLSKNHIGCRRLAAILNILVAMQLFPYRCC